MLTAASFHGLYSVRIDLYDGPPYTNLSCRIENPSPRHYRVLDAEGHLIREFKPGEWKRLRVSTPSGWLVQENPK